MDWNADGKLDILSGCYWIQSANEGQIQCLEGQGGNDFAESYSIKSVDDKTLANVTVPEDAAEPYDFKNICTHQHAVDYDSDGDLDLVVGCISANFFLFRNEPKDGKPGLPTIGEQLEIASPKGHAGPHFVDWDNDGDLDLLTGTGQGGALISINTGNASEPSYAKFQQLVPGTNSHEQSLDDGPVQPGPESRVWAYDWNHDGLVDLLVGDSVTTTKRKAELSDAKFAELKSDYEKRMQEAQDAYQKIMDELGEIDYDNLPADVEKKMSEASQNMYKIMQTRSEFQTVERTGHVWLYLRKPATEKVAAK
ncbi:MAG: VCBS repeat-containing protein [Planctomycetota bacterium]